MWLKERLPLVLCGPPGSGKYFLSSIFLIGSILTERTMTLTNTLRALPTCEAVELNFSSATSPAVLHDMLGQYCEFHTSPHSSSSNGSGLGGGGEVVVRPRGSDQSKWLIFFLDEVNLPTPDQYGTQPVISYLRQLIEMGGYWRPSDYACVRLERIQFVAACNPPTDAGRHPLPSRLLRHAPVLYVDYPAQSSLTQIYSTFVAALTRPFPEVRIQVEVSSLHPISRFTLQGITEAMIAVYLWSQQHFTSSMHAHYIYSPRELS